MSRLTWVVAGIIATGGATGGVAFAEGQAELAAKLNDEGKQLMFGNDFPGASAKFRDAVARAPEPKYFFNLCMSLYQEGKFDDAFTACTAVGQNNPSAEQKDKAEKLIGRIKDEAKAQGLELHLGGGGGGNPDVPPDPTHPPEGNNPDPNHPPEGNNPPVGPVGGGPPPNDPNYRPVVGRPPTAMLLGSKPDNHYTWSLGGDLFAGGGVMGGAYSNGSNIYGSVAGGFRLKADYMLVPAARIGAQGYIQYTQFTPGAKDTMDAASLQVIDFGVAGYKHLCLASHESICLTPLLGVHVSTMSPQGNTGIDPSSGDMTALFNYVGVGARAEVNLAIAFGPRQEHVFNAAVGVNAYSKVLAGPAGDTTGTFVGLDSGGSVGYLGLGYTYRFNTPFGSSPFVTLE